MKYYDNVHYKFHIQLSKSVSSFKEFHHHGLFFIIYLPHKYKYHYNYVCYACFYSLYLFLICSSWNITNFTSIWKASRILYLHFFL